MNTHVEQGNPNQTTPATRTRKILLIAVINPACISHETRPRLMHRKAPFDSNAGRQSDLSEIRLGQQVVTLVILGVKGQPTVTEQTEAAGQGSTACEELYVI